MMIIITTTNTCINVNNINFFRPRNDMPNSIEVDFGNSTYWMDFENEEEAKAAFQKILKGIEDRSVFIKL